MQRKKFLSTLVTILTLLCQGSGYGVADVRLSGTQDRVVLETNNAPIGEIVTALRTAFGIEVTRGDNVAKIHGHLFRPRPPVILTSIRRRRLHLPHDFRRCDHRLVRQRRTGHSSESRVAAIIISSAIRSV